MMGHYDATLVSEKLIDTVNFYEDFFGFVPTVEKDGYVLLQKGDDASLRISVFEANHKCVKDVPPVQGLILNFPVADARKAYDHMYMEGLEMFKEYGTSIHGEKHFVVKDPNGVLINVVELARAREFEAA